MMSSCKNPPYNLYALHGFLGLHTDWSPFSWISHPVELTGETLDMPQWARFFNGAIKKIPGTKNILLGYSMGGRLALHALASNPWPWDAAIIISAHHGLDSAEERAARLQADRMWGEKFLHEPWEDLMREWNSNPLFSSRPFPFPREEGSFDRQQLYRQLTNWSLGTQEPLTEALKKVAIPTLYVAGELDTKFCALLKPFSRVSIIPQAAHRVPWDQPDEFTKQIMNFIKEIL